MLDPFHVVRLGTEALDQCRRRVQQQPHGHRGHKNDPPYRARQTLHTGEGTSSPTGNENASAHSSPTRTTPRSRPPGASCNG